MGRRLYIRNLDLGVGSDRLEEMFSAVGDVKSVSVVLKLVRGINHRVAYVEMSSHQEALDGIERFHGHKFNGQELIVTEDKPHVPLTPVVRKKKSALYFEPKKRTP